MSARIVEGTGSRGRADFRSELRALAMSARTGELAAAARGLRALRAPDALSEVERLDLLGRVEAQRGHYLEAMAAWQRTLELDPGHSAATAALAALQKRLQPRGIPRTVQASAMLLGCVALLIVVVVWAREVGAELRGIDAQLAVVRSGMDVHSEQIRSVETRWEQSLHQCDERTENRHAATLTMVEQSRAALAAAFARAEREQGVALDALSRELQRLGRALAESRAATTAELGAVADRVRGFAEMSLEAGRQRTAALASLDARFVELRERREREFEAFTARLAAFELSLREQRRTLQQRMNEDDRVRRGEYGCLLEVVLAIQSRLEELVPATRSKDSNPPARTEQGGGDDARSR